MPGKGPQVVEYADVVWEASDPLFRCRAIARAHEDGHCTGSMSRLEVS
jgi:hypothetical protein